MPYLPIILTLGLSLLAPGCAAPPTVRPQDLDIWVGMPVAALDKQPLFVTVSMIRTVTDDGTEVRNYASNRDFASCAGTGQGFVNGPYVSSDAFATCAGEWAGCNNIFRIKGGRVLDYAPTGRCTTNESVWPTARYLHPKPAGDQ